MVLLVSSTASFALPACPSDQTKRYHNCFGTYTFAEGDKYVGEWRDDKKNGQGTYTYADGDKYVGEYKDDKRTGQGTYTFASGNKYVGEFKDGKKNGQGTYTYAEGDKYVGEYKDDKKDGQGIYTFADGAKYFGEHKDGKKNGLGFFIFKNGRADFCVYVDGKESNCSGSDVYDVAPILTNNFRQLSEFKRKKIQQNLKLIGLYTSVIDGKWGRGTFSGLASYAALNLNTVNINNASSANTLFQRVLGSSSLTTGSCPADQSAYWDNCTGKITFDDGSKYVGEWKDDKQHGQGTYTFGPNTEWAGDKYVGEFKDDKRNGQGTYTYADGGKYVGEFKDGNSNGQGTSTYANGKKYVGEFKDNKWNGQGTFTWPNGDKYVGEFKDDKKNGQGALTTADGYVYVGEFKDDNFNGRGTYTYPNGDKYVGEFKDDKFNGRGTFTFASGNKYVGEFKDGDFNGQGTFTTANGNVYVGEFKDDKRNGRGTYTYADGTVKEGIWKNGEFQNSQAAPQITETDDPNETREVASGTGFYVSNEGHIITNYHVIDGCMDMKVHTKGRIIPTLRIADDELNDLALLKISETPSHVFALSNDSPFPLQEIVVAGFPFGESYSSSLKFTQGIVSSLTGIGNNYSEIQIDAALQPGNSGGPIIDEYGNIVGVAVAKLDAKYTLDNFGVIPENTNFGIKASAVKNLLEGNQVPLKAPTTELTSKRDLSRLATDGTVYLTCWMTSAQLEQMKSKKVMFGNLD